MGNLKIPYELSLWENVTIPTDNGEEFGERKVAVIGSDTSSAAQRAMQVSIEEQVSGEKTLTFEILRKIRNEEGELVDNPYLNVLINEAELKLRIGEPYDFFSTDGQTFIPEKVNEEDTEEKWLDFIIKDKDESSSEKIVKYTAKEQFVNELGKNGWSVTLDTELENNYGTLEELAHSVLDGSGWDVVVKDVLTEKAEEVLMTAVVTQDVTMKHVLSHTEMMIPAGERVYIFFSQVEYNDGWKLRVADEYQVLFKGIGQNYVLTDANEDGVIEDDHFTHNYVGKNLAVRDIGLATVGGVNLRGNRVVKSVNTLFNSDVNKYVKEYSANATGAANTLGLTTGQSVYGYEEAEYLTSSIVQNFLSNSKAFKSIYTWEPQISSGSNVPPYITSLPIATTPEDFINSNTTNYLALTLDNVAHNYYNEGPMHNRVAITQGDTYVIRWKARYIRRGATVYDGNISTSTQPAVTAELGYYDSLGGWIPVAQQGQFNLTTSQLETSGTNRGYGHSNKVNLNKSTRVATLIKDASGNPIPQTKADRKKFTGAAYEHIPQIDEQGYAYLYVKGLKSTNPVLDKIQLKIATPTTTSAHDIMIEDIQVFPYKEDIDGTPIFLGDIPSAKTKINNKFFYYNNGDVEYLPNNKSFYDPVFKSNFEQVRHINVKESNYLNNITELSELFEVWARFKVYHSKNGNIIKRSDGTPKKEVIFSKYSPYGNKLNSSGFKYGVNLNSIDRRTDSLSIATKVLVKNNNQEFATDGMASISRAHSNPSGENEIFNFDYYINQGLLSQNQVIADLYGMSSRDLGLYPKLRNYNAQLYGITKNRGNYRLELAKAEAALETIDIAIQEIREEIREVQSYYSALAVEDPGRERQMMVLTGLYARLREAQKEQAHQAQLRVHYNNLLDDMQEDFDVFFQAKKELKAQFYKKYARFLQEGTWIDEQYIDDEMYYLDAVKIANVNAFPQVTYTINVFDISAVEGFEAYNYTIGQKTFIEDTEFFGWTYNNPGSLGAIKTPYKMEVMVTSRKRNFDDPTDYTLTVQNYKDKFEDLFQRLTATANSLQYNEGQYAKVTQIVNDDGSIKVSTIEEAMMNNSFILGNSINQSVVWDSGRGIEITDTSNSALMTRIVAGGIFVSTNGGRTWTSGLSGEGINTRLLTSGQIDTERIHILSGGSLAFRWDGRGITSYATDGESYDAGRFVRYNQYGLYGTTTGGTLENALNDATSLSEKLDAIQDHSNWSLTWEGLILKNVEGGVSLHPSGGFQVFNPNWSFTQPVINDLNAKAIDPRGPYFYSEGDHIPLISLGRQYDDLGSAAHYGLRMRNNEGYLTLITDNTGNIWTKNTLELGQKDLVTVGIEQTDHEGVADIVEETYHRYIHLNGTPNIDLPYIESPMIAVGDTDIKQAPFRVYGDGYVIIQDADVTGKFTIAEADLTGNMSIGDVAGINGYPDELTGNIAYTFWSGKSENGEPTFYVRPDGFLYAGEAYINGTGTFYGDIYAESGHFRGSINAVSGNIEGQLFFGNESSRSYIGGSEGRILSINDGAFVVSDSGNIYGNVLRLSKNELWEDNDSSYNLVIGDKDYVFNIYNPSTLNPQEQTVFGVTREGDLEIAGQLFTQGDVILGGALVSEDGNMRIDGRRGSIEVNTPERDGWGIYSNGDAYFNNLTARGNITAAIFEYEHTSSIGGKMLISPSFMLIEEVAGILSDNNYSFNLSENVIPPSWKHVNSVLVNIENKEIDATFNYDNKLIVISGDNVAKINLKNNVLPKGTILISTSTEINSILLDATDPLGGYIKIEGPGDSDRSTVLLGNLKDSLIPTRYRSVFGTDLGYGLYADNVYLTGKMFLPQAGITDGTVYYGENIPGNEIRFFAGTTPTNMQHAPFIVTQDGSMYSTKGTFSGNVIAENSIFSGHIIASGVLLDEDLGSEFYFSKPWGLKLEPDYNDYVMVVRDSGVSVWNSFNIYSDYMSGYREDTLTDTRNTYYGYSSRHNESPFPILGIQDKNALEGFIPHISSYGQQIWNITSSLSDNQAAATRIKMFNGSVSFSNVSNIDPKGLGYSATDAVLWEEEDKLIIGRFKIKGMDKYGLKGNEIEFSDGENSALRIEPKTDVDGNRKNVSNVTIGNELTFGEAVKVEQVTNGILFTYLGA